MMRLIQQPFPRSIIGGLVFLCLAFSLSGCGNDTEPDLSTLNVEDGLRDQILAVIRQNPEAILESVQEYQKAQQAAQQQKAAEFEQQLVSDPKSVIGDSPVLGSESNKITLVEFSDFECPFCARAQETIKAFMEANGDEVTLVYKHLPLVQIHSEAIPAAEASWAAQQQGKFWEYHDRLFESQDQFGEEFYSEIANDLGLDLEQFDRDRAIAFESAIKADIDLAQALRLNSTPVFFLASTETGKAEVLPGALSLPDLNSKLEEIKTPAE